jgi:predicted PurR-regulated permease PerM
MMPWVFLAIFILSFYLIGRLFLPFVSIIVLGAVITGICNPVYSYMKTKTGPTIASCITCILIFLVLFVPIALFVSVLSKEAYALYLAAKNAVLNDRLAYLLEGSGVIDNVNFLLSKLNIELNSEALNKAFSQAGKAVGFFLYQQATAVASNMLSFLISFFLVLLVVFFLFIDGHRLVKFIVDLSPLSRAQDEELIQKFKDMSGAILIVNGLSGLIQGVLGGIVFALFGLETPFLWGLIMGLLAFLPILGIGLVLIPIAIYFFLSKSFWTGVFFLIFHILLSSIEYIFKPKLVGSRVKMHTLLVFFSIIGGLKLFGILGIIYGPLVVTAFLTLTDIYHSSYRKMIGPKGLDYIDL